MTHSDLVKVEVQGADISVAMRGTCFRVKYRTLEPPWLVAREYGPDEMRTFLRREWGACGAKNHRVSESPRCS